MEFFGPSKSLSLSPDGFLLECAEQVIVLASIESLCSFAKPPMAPIWISYLLYLEIVSTRLTLLGNPLRRHARTQDGETRPRMSAVRSPSGTTFRSHLPNVRGWGLGSGIRVLTIGLEGGSW